MQVFAFSAIALAWSAAAAQAQSVEFRILERFNDTVVLPADAAPTANSVTVGDANDRTLWFVVQARVSGLNPDAFNGLGGYAGTIQMTAGAGNGSFKASGTGGQGGSPTNSSPVSFFPAGTVDNGFGTAGVAHYAPFRLIAALGAGGNGSRLTATSGSLIQTFGATGGDALQRLADGEVTAAAWGVGEWINVYSFQFDVLTFNAPSLVFATNFNATYFNARSPQGVPNSIDFPSQSQGTYTVLLPGPAAAGVLGLFGLVASIRRRA